MLFAIDDSDIQIEQRPHTILAAIGVRDSSAVEPALDRLKAQFGLLPADEVKWNGMKPMPRQKREALSRELVALLHKSVALVVINEGRNKQAAAERLAVQIADCVRGARLLSSADPFVELAFDEGILDDERRYSQYLHTLAPSPVASGSVATHCSHESAAVQLADVLAGLNRLATDIALGRANKDLSVQDDVSGREIEIDLLSYISLGLRWAMWGSVPPPPDPDNVTFDRAWPFKQVGGYGLRIHSTISAETLEKIYGSRVVYIGCMH